MLVSGEAGIGKTSLVRAFALEAAARARTLAGACDDLVTARTLGPFRDIARRAGPTPLDEVRSVMAVFDATLFRLVPATYRSLEQALAATASGTGPPPFPAGPSGGGRGRTGRSPAQAIRHVFLAAQDGLTDAKGRLRARARVDPADLARELPVELEAIPDEIAAAIPPWRHRTPGAPR